MHPGLDVRLVFHFREHDFRARGDFQRSREVHEELGGGGADDDLVAGGIHVGSGGGVAFFVFGVGEGARVVGGAELDVGFGEVLRYARGLISGKSNESGYGNPTNRLHRPMFGFRRRCRGTPGLALVRGSARERRRHRMWWTW